MGIRSPWIPGLHCLSDLWMAPPYVNTCFCLMWIYLQILTHMMKPDMLYTFIFLYWIYINVHFTLTLHLMIGYSDKLFSSQRKQKLYVCINICINYCSWCYRLPLSIGFCVNCFLIVVPRWVEIQPHKVSSLRSCKMRVLKYYIEYKALFEVKENNALSYCEALRYMWNNRKCKKVGLHYSIYGAVYVSPLKLTYHTICIKLRNSALTHITCFC